MMTKNEPIDLFDRAILRIIQDDNQLSHAAIGERVGLSGSAVRRRITRLRSKGVIAKEVAVLDRDNIGVTLIVQVTFAVDTVSDYHAFDELIAASPHIKQGYHVSGSTDYVLIVQGPSLQWYEDWAKETLLANSALKRHDTAVVYSCKKFDTSVEV